MGLSTTSKPPQLDLDFSGLRHATSLCDAMERKFFPFQSASQNSSYLMKFLGYPNSKNHYISVHSMD